MSDERDFRPRPGRIRHRGTGDSRSFVGQVLAATRKAGGGHASLGGLRASRASVFGRGRPSSVSALQRVGGRSRAVLIKARVVRQASGGAPLGVHVTYLQREGVDRASQPGRLFDRAGDEVDGRAFAERCAGDRHHFRFIVSPEDAAELSDLRAFTRDLMDQAAADLGAPLDWVAVDHWNTAHPHVHVLIRGEAAGGDLVISRDYISSGLRARASELVTLELGLRTDRQIRRGLEAEIAAERWTKLDRSLARDAAAAGGVIDLRPDPGDKAGELRRLKLARLGKLERLGLATSAGRGRWRLAPDAEPTLQALARRGDIIARIHRSLAEGQVERPAERWRLEAEEARRPIVGRLMGRGLDDELKGSAWVVVDGVDGGAHHLRLPSLEAASDAPVGAVVEVRWLDGRSPTPVLAVRSDVGLERQIAADGATWLDRQLVGHARAGLADDGFGAEVSAALDQRAERLERLGLARRTGEGVQFARNLIETLQRRELATTASELVSETGLEHRPLTAGDAVSGIVRRRLVLASGRFAMIDDGLGFSLVPWRAELERRLGQQVTGIALPGGGFDWTRGRGLGR